MKKKINVVMVVNNPGSTDSKVKKTAEFLSANNLDVSVVCLHSENHSYYDDINGVKYYRFPLQISLKSALVGFWPELYAKKISKLPSKDILNTVRKGENNRELGKISAKNITFKSKLRFRIAKLIFKNKMFFPLILRGCYFVTFYQVLKDLEPDYFHAHELDSLESCVLASKGKKTKVIYDSHELEIHRNLQWSKIAMKLRKHLEKKYINQVENVITVSPGCSQVLKDVYKITNVITVRNTPKDQFVFFNTSKSIRDKLGLDENVPLLVYTGSVTLNRGVEDILLSLKYLPGYHFVTVGPYNSEVVGSLNSLAKNEKIDDRVHFEEKVSPEELIPYIRSADISVIPIKDSCLSYRYCLPNKLFEAMFANLPVVASSLPDMKAVIKQYNIGEVYTDSSPQNIAGLIQNVYNNKMEYYTDINNKKIHDELIFEQEAQKLLEIYDVRK